jgi:hypothetical protein
MNDGVKRYRAGYEGEMYQIAYIDEEVGKDEPDPILRDVWVADADYDALKALFMDTRSCGPEDDPCWCTRQWRKRVKDRHSEFCQQARAVLKERP